MKNKFPSILTAVFSWIVLGFLSGMIADKLFPEPGAAATPSMRWARVMWHDDDVYKSSPLDGYIMPDSQYQSWSIVATSELADRWGSILNIYTKNSNLPTAAMTVHRYRLVRMEDNAGPEDKADD